GENQASGFHFVGSTCTVTVNVIERPYHKVYGGDVLAGTGAGTTCVVDPAAAIIAWHNGPGPANAGAGTQLAAMALSSVISFASGQARAPTDYDHLTFANPGVSGLIYGGSLGGGNATCAPDYWADRSGGAVPGVINPSHDGSFSHTGNLTLNVNPAGIGTGNRVTVFVEGNVYIPNNINFQTNSYGSIDDIPSFRLIVRGGNIYVGPNVRTLNGLFAAMPTNATNGRFYTCGNSNFTPPNLAQINSVAGCRNSLTVYGAVVADLIKFTRSGGSLRFSSTGERWNGGGQPAERFIYTPETWLTSDFSGGGEFDAVTPLPPVL
ncbi:MAG: hypothetical protein ACRD4B_08880, partial [Acidobacteriota bacterium]